MKKALLSLLLLLFLAGGLLLSACGGSGMTAEEWQNERNSGDYSQDYLLTPARKFCARLSESGKAVEIFDSGSGNLCGTLDFAEHSDVSPHPSFSPGLMEFSDHDGDGYSDFGIPMADGSIIWYKYSFGSDPTKEKDCFSFLGLQPDAFVLPVDSDAVSDAASGEPSDLSDTASDLDGESD